MFGNIATPPNGTIFWLIILVILAMFFGWVFSLLRLPPLLGMLIIGKIYIIQLVPTASNGGGGGIIGWRTRMYITVNICFSLFVGIIVQNIPGVKFDSWWQPVSSTLRSIALVVILMRAGLGYNKS